MSLLHRLESILWAKIGGNIFLWLGHFEKCCLKEEQLLLTFAWPPPWSCSKLRNSWKFTHNSNKQWVKFAPCFHFHHFAKTVFISVLISNSIKCFDMKKAWPIKKTLVSHRKRTNCCNLFIVPHNPLPPNLPPFQPQD